MAEMLFIGFSVLALGGAVGMVAARHPLNGAMSFIVTLLSIAGLYALMSASFIFAVQLIVYAGAIMSLSVFIIMFLNVRRYTLPEEPRLYLRIIGAAFIVAPIGMLLYRVVVAVGSLESVGTSDDFGSIHEVGMVLFTSWIYPVEALAVLLLVVLVSAVVLAGRGRQK